MQLNKNAEVVNGKKQIYTELVVAAHQDDIEIMAYSAIIECYNKKNKWFMGVKQRCDFCIKKSSPRGGTANKCYKTS